MDDIINSCELSEWVITCSFTNYYRVFQKKAQSLRTTILQPYVTVSWSFQLNVQKEIVYMNISEHTMNMAMKFFVL